MIDYKKLMKDYLSTKKCEITLTYKCNGNCKHCYFTKETRNTHYEMDLKKAYERIYTSYKDGCTTLALIGGEPTVYPNLLKVVNFAKKLGYKYILLLTNGIKLADENYTKALIENGVNLFKLSLHSIIPQKHDDIMGVRGSFNLFVKACENINKYNGALALDTVVMKKNYTEIPELVDFVIKKIGAITFNFVSCHYNGELEKNIDEFKVSYTEQSPYVKEGANRFKENNVIPPIHLFSNYPPCILPGYEHLIADWEINNMDDLYLPDNNIKGNIGKALQSTKIKLKQCKECIYNEKCIGVERKYVEIFGDKEFIPLYSKPKRFPLKLLTEC
jgi:MoaA/NifB/PqqE/SkfB family radical SAM enzyme